MKPAQTTLALAGCLAILLLAGAAEPYIRDGLSPSSFVAAVKKAATTTKSTTAAKTNEALTNVFTHSKIPYLTLTSPYFNFITLISPATSPATTDTALQSPAVIIKPNDVLTVTNPQSFTPVTNIEHSLVNIFCSQKMSGNVRKVITGSGVVIQDGLVLTDAHVGVYPLAADSNSAITCLARTGSPAAATHSVRVVFISPEWVRSNGPQIAGSYTETGENDYALLKISPLVSGKSASSALVPLHIEGSVPDIGGAIKAAAYPANVLGTKGVDAPLVSQTEQLSVRSLLNFDGSVGSPSNAELLETSASAIGQQGSSGGAIADQNNNIIGLISNVVGSSDSAGTFIHSLTITGINNTFDTYSSAGLSGLVLFGPDRLQSTFDQSYRASLTSIVTRALSL